MLKNYVKQTIRTPVKTSLFIALIAFTSILLTIGFAMYISGEEEIKQANKNFVAEVIVENKELLENGGNAKAQNINLKEIDIIKNSPYVDRFDVQRNLVGYAENFVPYHNSPYMTVYDTYPFSVFDITILPELNVDGVKFQYKNSNSDFTIFQAKVNNVLAGDEELEEIYIRVYEQFFNEDFDKIFEPNKRYVINTFFGEKRLTNYSWTYGQAISDYDAIAWYGLYPIYEDYITGGNYIAAYEVKDDNYMDDPEFEYYKRIIDITNINNKEFDIAYVNRTNDIKSFYKKELVVEDGRDITDEEYENGEKVCLISRHTFNKNKLKLGDKISFKYRENENNLVGFEDYVSSLQDLKDREFYDEVETYEIVGVYSGKNLYASYQDSYSFDQNLIVVPMSTFPIENASSTYNSELCGSSNLTITLNNSSSKNDFILDLKAQGLDFDKYHLIVNTYGVESIINTFNEMRQTSVILIVSCIIVAFIIIFFIVFLFVSKRKMDTAILVALGTKRRKIIAGYLVSISLIVLIGSGLGVAIGTKVAENVINEAYVTVKDEMTTVGQMFSTSYSVNYAKNFNKKVNIPFVVPAGIVASIFTVTLLMGGISVRNNLKKEPMVLLSTKERWLYD